MPGATPGPTMHSRIAVIIILLAAIFTACDRTPGGVIPKKKMASLLADIHTAESVVETERRVFGSESMKMVLKQSVLAANGFTVEEFDSSLSYYGRNIDVYAKLYDDVIEILESRIARAEIEGAGESSTSLNAMGAMDMSFEGDSVDVWTLPRTLFFTRTAPSNLLAFNVNSDGNWEMGDVYTLRGRMHGASEAISMAMAVEYFDGSIDHFSMRSVGNGWKEAVLATDSSKTARTVYGTITYPISDDIGRPTVILDSISLYRSRYRSDVVRDPRTRTVNLSR